MKKIISFIAVMAMTSIVIAQAQLERTVTINVTGTRIKQINVDSKTYTISNLSTTEEQPILINGLQNGQHTLELFRSNRTVSSQTTFTLREGYDMTISINNTGAVSMTETRTKSRDDYRSAISAQAFNRIFIATKNRTSSASRNAYLENQFSSNRMFTSKQASQLIQLVNSESFRLQLAKDAYGNITDPNNYSLVSSLLNSTNSRLELNNYIASYANDNADDNNNTGNAYTPITQEKFNAIYAEVSAETSLEQRKYYLSNFFGKEYNYYTSAQVKELIRLINSEGERFNLAKLAYRGVTDKDNYGEVISLLTMPSNRTTLRNYIASYNNTNTSTGVAMSATDFSRLYQAVYNNNSSTARYNALNTAFTTAGNYFTVTQARQLIQLVNNESSRLLLSKSVYRILVDRANYTQLNDLLASQSSRNDLDAYVRNYGNSYGAGVAMNDNEFNTIYTNISNSWSSSTRYSRASEAFNNAGNYFTTAQVRRVLLLINSESERLTLAKGAYDNVVDQASYSQLYDVFTSTDGRNELARYIGDMQNGGTGTRIAMTDAEFQSIYRDVQLTFGLGAKMGRLTEIFNRETNYFTVQQARQLIQLVSAESNRLELAKAAYNNVTDPTNFTQLYDIFTSQSSKDELSAYISNASLGN
ncbi:MAG TPA: DUF4476 domain-containing protein [Chitinophagaceae bacterium]|nr:DUF4476 domain-containing protein [Chitinophagaceae bacterium]